MSKTVTLYVSEAQAAIWDEAREAAVRANVSLSRLASDALAEHLAKNKALDARARPIWRAAIRQIEAALAASDQEKRSEQKPKPKPKPKSPARKGAKQ